MQLPYSPELNIAHFSRIFDNKSESYKLFWFQAIMAKLVAGQTIISYGELVDEMVASAWYMVTEYHLNLGPKDNLEALVQHIQQKSQMRPSEKRETILQYLAGCEDKEIKRLRNVLSKNVPYRLQAPLISGKTGEGFWSKGGNGAVIERINQQERLMYYIEEYKGLHTRIILQPEWVDYLLKNQEIVRGWLQYNMIIYLQKRNPSVPGIADKLYPPQERNLQRVNQYWKLILTLHPLQEIYDHIWLEGKDISIDHFVPWSYVAHDELWNLHPTTKSINSSKSNQLPEWERYFPELCRLEYLSYQMLWQNERVHEEFDRCAREHLNNPEIRRRLYRCGLDEAQFCGQLEEIMLPVYQSAKNCGFENWVYQK